MTPILACGWEFVASMVKYKCCKSLIVWFSIAEDVLKYLMIMVLFIYYAKLISL